MTAIAFDVQVSAEGKPLYRGTASIALMKLFEHAFGLDLITISGKKASEAKPLIDTIASKWLDTGFREHYREMHEDIDGWGPYDAGLAMLDGMKDACAKNSAAIVEIAENS